jgi:hypothetical protein
MISKPGPASDFPELHFPTWQDAYQATLQPTDTISLFKLVEIAEAAILTRRDSLKGTAQGSVEQRAIEDALQTLSSIKRRRLKFA